MAAFNRRVGTMGAARAAVQSAPAVAAVANCPAGLEYLTVVDTVIVEQMVEMIEVMTGIETANRYILRNGLGQQIYYAMEMSNNMQRQLGGKSRQFTMVLLDNAQHQVCRIHRPQAHPMMGGSRCMVESPLGVNIGYIMQNGSGFLCCDGGGQPWFLIIPPAMAVGTHPFQVVSATTMMPVGQIVKHYGGAWKEVYTDADTFSVHFPLDLNPQLKAVLVAATFLIDFMYFDDTGNDRRNKFH